MSQRRLDRLLSGAQKPMLSAALALSSTLWISGARASAEYFTILQQEYSYTGSDCLICHQTPFGEKGNATKDFALTLQGMGLVSEQPNLLRSVMSELEAELEQTPEEATDSDGDGVPDLVEITDQGDPNDPTIKPGGFTPVEYGCSIVKPVGHSGQSRDENPLAFMLSTLVAGALLLDRRRRQRRSA